MQYALLVCGLVAFASVYFFLPETSHPQTLGIDKVRMAAAERSAAESGGREQQLGRKTGGWVWLNPLASLWLLRSPNILCVVRVIINEIVLSKF